MQAQHQLLAEILELQVHKNDPWQITKPVKDKLYGDVHNHLQMTAHYIKPF
jgi:hypothetical protein